jgi:hypothetical protein
VTDPVEFLFVDESGDPGPDGTPLYVMACIHVDGPTLYAVQTHLVNFRYHHGIKGELKDWGGLLKDQPTSMTRALLRVLVELTDPKGIRATANWLDKATYKTNRGPRFDDGSPTHWFQNYQLRRLLGRHSAHHPLGDNADLVLDRWPMTIEQRLSLRNYLREKCDLRPPPAHITVADSSYVPMVDLVDFYARLARRVAEGSMNPEYESFCKALMNVKEITGGLY